MINEAPVVSQAGKTAQAVVTGLWTSHTEPQREVQRLEHLLSRRRRVGRELGL